MPRRSDLPALPTDRPGILPLLRYKRCGRDYAHGWDSVWYLGWGIFRTKIIDDNAEDGWDYAFLELRAQYSPMYDFCGGLLTSSLSATVHQVMSRRKKGASWAWGSPEQRTWRMDYEMLGPWKDSPRNARGDWERPGQDRRTTMKFYSEWADNVPEAGPFIGDVPRTRAELVDIGRRSIASWLVGVGTDSYRRCIFGADRTSLRSGQSRAIVRTAALQPKVRYFPSSPTLYFARVTTDKPTDWYKVPVFITEAFDGNPFSMCEVNRCQYIVGMGHSNANTNARVSVYNLIVPPPAQRGVNLTIPKALQEEISQEWGKMTTPGFARMLPNQTFHNG